MTSPERPPTTVPASDTPAFDPTYGDATRRCPECAGTATWCVSVDETNGAHDRYCDACKHEWVTVDLDALPVVTK